MLEQIEHVQKHNNRNKKNSEKKGKAKNNRSSFLIHDFGLGQKTHKSSSFWVQHFNSNLDLNSSECS